MDIAKITLKELLTASKIKVLLSNILGNIVLEEYKGSKEKVVVVKGTTVQINQPPSFAESVFPRNHEEADTIIPLHVIDAIGNSFLRGIDVYSRLTLAHGPYGSWTAWCIHQAQFPHWNR